MRVNKLFLSLLAIIGVTFVFFMTTSIFDLNRYFSLSHQGEATILTTRIHERGSDQYLLISMLSYQLEGTHYFIEKEMKAYPNRLAAERGGKKWEKLKKVTFWYNPKDPLQTKMEKKFPYKTTLTTILLFFLGIYFISLKTFLREKEK